MVDNLKRFRQPLAWIAILVLVAGLVLSVVKLVIAITKDATPLFAAFQDIANSAMSLTLVLVLVALVWSCLFVTPATPDARRITLVAAIVVSVGTILTLVAMVIGVQASAGVLGVILEFLGGLLDFILKAIASLTLWLILRAVSGGRMGPGRSDAVAAAPAPAAVEPAAPRRPATWEPGAAAGQVWRTAAEAAAGEPPVEAEGGTSPAAPVWRRVEKGERRAESEVRVAGTDERGVGTEGVVGETGSGPAPGSPGSELPR